MAETKHTSGPWEYREIAPYDDGIGYISADGYDIIHAGVSDLPAEENRANARLIASAPDLLAELKKLRRAYVDLLELGRDRIIALGGTCDPVDAMESGDPSLRSSASIVAKAEGSSHE